MIPMDVHTIFFILILAISPFFIDSDYLVNIFYRLEKESIKKQPMDFGINSCRTISWDYEFFYRSVKSNWLIAQKINRWVDLNDSLKIYLTMRWKWH